MAINELGFERMLFEDRKADLDSYAASMIFSGGNSCRGTRQGKSKMSYFLMVLRKASASN
jgi:hypothetical protein